MPNMKVLQIVLIAFASLLFSALQYDAESYAGGKAHYEGRYFANAVEGRMSLTIAQRGGHIAGQLNGLKGYVYQLNGEVRPDGIIAGVARVGRGGLYFVGAITPSGLQMLFAEPAANGQPNQKTAKIVIFTPAQTSRQNSGLPQAQNRNKHAAGMMTLEQCNKAHTDCMTRCRGEWNCMQMHCNPINEKCIAIKNASGGKSGPSGDVELIIRDSQIRTMDAMHDRWRIMDQYR